jgi:F0F1-type ATP synthase epsilon subunit
MVLTPAETLLEVEAVEKVRLKLEDGGWLSIYPLHAPLIAETMAGNVSYIEEGMMRSINVAAGILQIAGGDITIFTSGEIGAEAAGRSPEELAEEAERFDRLARQLLIALRAQPTGVMGGSYRSE